MKTIKWQFPFFPKNQQNIAYARDCKEENDSGRKLEVCFGSESGRADLDRVTCVCLRGGHVSVT